MNRATLYAASTILLLNACDRTKPDAVWVPPIPFDTTEVVVVGSGDSVRVKAEVAATSDQRAFGLMVRPRLDATSGMIFVYDSVQGADRGFWMYRTKIPLDIAFADSAGVIVSVRTMDPCDVEDRSACRTYAPDAPYWMALEVNRGFFAQHGIAAGDTIIVRGTK